MASRKPGPGFEPFEAKMQDGKWTCFDTTDLLEAEVAAMLAEGGSLRKIAAELGVSHEIH